MADAASQKEWPRSKLIGATSRNKFWEPQQDITGRPVFKIKYIISRSIDRLVYTESYRSGHNGADSKHSRVRHDCISVNPLFIGGLRTSVCTLTNLHLAVFSQFGIKALPLQFYMETYRSGHNGADSKSVREQSPASSNLAVSAKDSLKVLSFKEFSLFIPRLSRLPLHLLSYSHYQCGCKYWRWFPYQSDRASPESFSLAHRLRGVVMHNCA